MLWLLIFLLPTVELSIMIQTPSHQDDHKDGDVSSTTRPHIYRCRSPNMEEFTCWWLPLQLPPDSLDPVVYNLTYSLEKSPKMECPDYESAGQNSCHFDRSHTSVWKVYCMEVTAITQQGNYTSEQHCLDVQEIVELEAPVNLTYSLLKDSKADDGRTVKVSWVYPVPDHIQFGWISLDFELKYRHISEPSNWKVKGLLQEFSLVLLDLPAGEYLVQVRCRPRRHGLWSRWSSSLLLTVPGEPPPDRLMALLLVMGVGIMALLGIGCGVMPHSRRIKAFLLPPIPRPRISGIDPLLVKQKGSMEEINRHFLSLHGFHGYKPPSYSEEFWDMISSDGNMVSSDGNMVSSDGYMVSSDSNPTVHGNPGFKEVEGRLNMAASSDPTPTAAQTQATPSPNPNTYLQSPFPYCQSTLWVSKPLEPAPAELLSFPGSDYSLMASPSPASTFNTALSTSQDFYTCVNGMSAVGAVQLVPCLPGSTTLSSCVQLKGQLDEEEAEKSHQLADYLERKMHGGEGGGMKEKEEEG